MTTREGGVPDEAIVLALVPDLMDRSKVAAALPRTVFGATAGDVIAALAAAPGARLVLVDLSRARALEVVQVAHHMGVATVGFASHVDQELHQAARDAGCGRVMARSAFFRDVAGATG